MRSSVIKLLNYVPKTTFDAVGNRMSLQDSRGTQVYRYDEADELLEVESDFCPEEPEMKGKLLTQFGASDADKPLFKTTYGWDADGNQVSKTGPGNKTATSDFDSMDRLIGVSAPGSTRERYLYNADRQRVATMHGQGAEAEDGDGTTAREMQGVSERFLHLGRGRQVLGDLDGNGKMTKRYILLPSGQLLAHVDTAGTKPAFYHFDALGSTMVMSDSWNRIIARLVYDPFGARRGTRESVDGYGYIGREGVRVNSGRLLEMGARQYDSYTGSFLSCDPISRISVNALAISGQSYGYALNNPLRYRDPSGLQFLDPIEEQAQALAREGMEAAAKTVVKVIEKVMYAECAALAGVLAGEVAGAAASAAGATAVVATAVEVAVDIAVEVVAHELEPEDEP